MQQWCNLMHIPCNKRFQYPGKRSAPKPMRREQQIIDSVADPGTHVDTLCPSAFSGLANKLSASLVLTS